MKTLKALLFVSLIISACLFQACDSTSDYNVPLSSNGPPKWTEPPKPVFSIEKRNNKYGLWAKTKLVFDFQYDSIRPGRWPVAINEKGKFALITEDTFNYFGPFKEIRSSKSSSKGYLEVTTDTSSGVIYTQSIIHPNGLVVLVPYPHSELITDRLFFVKTKNMDKMGIIYVGFNNKGKYMIEWLPVDKYFYMNWRFNREPDALLSITINYYKKNGDYCKYSIDNYSPTDIIARGNITKEMGITFATKFHNGSSVVQSSVDGKFGLMNLDRQLVVPVLYDEFEEIGDSLCKFTSISEEIIVNRSTGQRF